MHSRFLSWRFLLSLPLLGAPAAGAETWGEQLLSSDPTIQARAQKRFDALSAPDRQALVPEIMSGLQDERPEVRRRATALLKGLGISNQEGTAQRISPNESRPRSGESLAADPELHELRRSKQDTDWRRSLDDEKKAPALDARDELSGQRGGVSAASTLLAALEDPDPWVRARAAKQVGLSRTEIPEVVPLLTKLLQDRDLEVRLSAIGALGGLGAKARPAIPALAVCLNDADKAVRSQAAWAMRRINEDRPRE